MTELARISATTLNQFALDFEGNYHRILRSIELAKKDGSRMRCGPELEICGYNCQDHFYEMDTITHSWEVLGSLLNHEIAQEILVDVGMPVNFKGVTYNCRIVFLNRKIYLIRPKMLLCDDDNYHESRWFTSWPKKRMLSFPLPQLIRDITKQDFVPFGDGLLQLSDTMIGFEICEELWNPHSLHIDQSLAGAEIIINGSGSYAELRNPSYVTDMIKIATSKCGIAYVFSNLRGCDGERVYYNNSSSITLNGNIIAIGDQHGLKDVEVCTASFDLNEIRSRKAQIRSRGYLAAQAEEYPSVNVEWKICDEGINGPSKHISPQFFKPEEVISLSPSLWLWDYLRRSQASGFLLPLSGGIDSSSVALIVYSMCDHIVNFIKRFPEDLSVLKDIQKILKCDLFPKDAKDLCGKILTSITCYMESEGSITRKRAEDLAKAIGSNHLTINIAPVVQGFVKEVSKSSGAQRSLEAEYQGLSQSNIQARSRMVFARIIAENRSLLVLGSTNVDEAIFGDSSGADINPIGGISRADLKNFLLYAGRKHGLKEFIEVAEDLQNVEGQVSPNNNQNGDKMTCEELSLFGKLRKPLACGPFSMVARLLHLWKDKHEPAEISRKAKHFYTAYASNRQKMTTLTPAPHIENYSPEDHRFDFRPIIYPLDFTWQFRKIDEFICKYIN